MEEEVIVKKSHFTKLSLALAMRRFSILAVSMMIVFVASLCVSSIASAQGQGQGQGQGVLQALQAEIDAEETARIEGDAALQQQITIIELTPGPTGPQGATGAAGADGTLPPGNAPGDMQYWDGTDWLLIPAPSVPLGSMQLNLCAGVPQWGVCTYAIGETGPAGGIVFYITDGGRHGLEAAPEDQSDSAGWGCGMEYDGADGRAVGTGALNTAHISATPCASRSDAANVVTEAYTLNGYNGWFLPSKDELNLLYNQRVEVGGFYNVPYWSSSEMGPDEALTLDFGDGVASHDDKQESRRVRAIRAF